MNTYHNIENIQHIINYTDPDNSLLKTTLFSGVDLYFIKFTHKPIRLNHEAINSIIQINYCHKGQLCWKMKNQNVIYLNHGDYSLHTMKTCCESLMLFPQGYYEGLTICIDFEKLKAAPLTLFEHKNYTPYFLYDKFCSSKQIVSIAASKTFENIFAEFYSLPDKNTLNYARLKFLELLVLLENFELTSKIMLKEHSPNSIAIMQQIHDYILQNINRHITIQQLSNLYHINTTTLKTSFKNIYGISIGAYVRKQRLHYAARLLAETNLSIAEIAQACGYNNQSKFSAAFKAFFDMLPKNYRKQKNTTNNSVL